MLVTLDERERSPLPLSSLLIRGLPVAIICAAACAVAAGLLSASRDAVYTANALVLMSESVDPVTGNVSGLDEGEGVSTQALLVDRHAVLARVADRSRDVTVDELESSVAVSQVGKTDILRVTASANRPASASSMANYVARTFVSLERQSTARRARAAETVLRRQLNRLSTRSRESLQGVQLRERIQSLSVLQEIGSPAPRVIEEARPPEGATSPLPRRDAIFGGLFGLLLGVGLAVLWVASDRRIRDPEDASEALGAPMLASFRRRHGLRARRGARREEEQAWRLMLHSLRVREDNEPVRTLSVTTVGGGGRSRVAWGLAATAAAAGERVLIIAVEPEAKDLNGEIQELDGNRLRALLAGDAALSEAVTPVPVPFDGTHQFDVVLGRASDGSSMTLAESPRLGDTLREAAGAYELVVIDTPSLLDHAEGIPLVTQADGTVVVVSDHADRERLIALRGRLEALRVRVLGLVVSRG